MTEPVADDPSRALSDEEIADVLESGALEITGRLVSASNASFYATATLDGVAVTCVYKPIRGERPLWDFPNGTLAGREVASYLVSELGGWGIVPTTVMGDGPFGPGMLQRWIDVAADDEPVDIVPEGQVPDGMRHVLDAFDARDNPVSLVHEDTARLRRVAVYDIVINNADRKGGHLLPDAHGRLFGCDHGVSLHTEHKLRTVLWGWAGEALSPEEEDQLAALRQRLSTPEAAELLGRFIDGDEIEAIIHRADDLERSRTLPWPGGYGPSIPWPAF